MFQFVSPVELDAGVDADECLQASGLARGVGEKGVEIGPEVVGVGEEVPDVADGLDAGGVEGGGVGAGELVDGSDDVVGKGVVELDECG